MAFDEGDYFFSKAEDESGKTVYNVYRCLKLDREFEIAHTMFFMPLSKEPKESDIKNLQLMMMHAPVHPDGFDDPVVFGTAPVQKDQLEGYYEHLRYTDFQAFIDETGADVEMLAKKAEKLFDQATKLAEQEKHGDAADFYYQAYETFPPYFEAVDNAGLCLMDAERYEDAMSCFEQSIETNHNTFLTDFSMGECYLRLGNEKEAKKWFQQARDIPAIDAEQIALVDEFLKG